MSIVQIIGVVVLVVGVALLTVGYYSSTAPLDQVSNTLLGRFTGPTMWYLIVGVGAIVGGALLALFGR